ARPAADAAERLEVAVEAADEPGRTRYRASVELRPPGAAAPAVAPADDSHLIGAGPPPRPLAELYRDWLFHGPLLHGIAPIGAIGPGGARATLRCSAPADCLAGQPAGDWLIDPVVVDSAFQLQVIWARLHWDVTLLPARVGAYERLGPRPASGRLRLEMRL